MRSPSPVVFSLLVLAAVATATAQPRPRGTTPKPARPVIPPPLPPPPPPEPTPPPGPPPLPPATVAQLQATLQLMRDKGLIPQTEYEEALAGRAVAVPAPLKPVVAPKWDTTLYGFIEADAIVDSTQSDA